MKSISSKISVWTTPSPTFRPVLEHFQTRATVSSLLCHTERCRQQKTGKLSYLTGSQRHTNPDGSSCRRPAGPVGPVGLVGPLGPVGRQHRVCSCLKNKELADSVHDSNRLDLLLLSSSPDLQLIPAGFAGFTAHERRPIRWRTRGRRHPAQSARLFTGSCRRAVTESRVTWWRSCQACLFWFWEKVLTFLFLLSQRKLWPRVSVGVGRRDKGATEDVFACFRSRLHLAHVASQTVAERRRRQQQEALLFARCLHKQPSSYLWPQI